MASDADPKPTGATKLVAVRDFAPAIDPTTGRPAPGDWESPRLWTPGELMCVAIGKMTFDDPATGRVTLEVSIWRDPLDPRHRYSAMVETY